MHPLLTKWHNSHLLVRFLVFVSALGLISVTFGGAASGSATDVRNAIAQGTDVIAPAGQPLDRARRSQPATLQLPPLVRGMAGDSWADVIVGKSNWGAISPFTTTASKLFWPYAVIVDRSSTTQHLFIYDSGNNRILGLNLDACLQHSGSLLGCSADLVLGQPDMTHSGCNGDSAFQSYPQRPPAGPDTLCSQPEYTLSVLETGSGSSMALDAAHNLYVTDFFNHRVLRYADPFATDRQADEVWGQADFQANLCNRGLGHPAADSLCFSSGSSNNWAAGVDLDAQGNLWVVDSGNQRILRFPAGSHTADLVLGQTSFTTGGGGAGLNQFRDPAALRFSPQGKLYVADHGNDRVLVFDPPFSTGMSGRLFGSGWVHPSGVDFDPTQAGVWLFNSGQNRLELWDETTQVRLKTLGGTGNTLDYSAGSIGIDRAGNYYVAVAGGEFKNDVVMYVPGGSTVRPDRMLFGPGAGNAVTGAGILRGGGVAVADNQLLVADYGRILAWNDPQNLTVGQAADVASGGVVTTTQINPYCCYTLAADQAHHLWVSTYRNNGTMPDTYIEIYNLPLTMGATPVATLQWPLPVLGGGTLSYTGAIQVFWGIAPAPDGSYVWLSNSATNRAFRVRNPLTAPLVDVILGQTSASGVSCNRGGAPQSGATPNTLCLPGSLALDRYQNLYVSDSSLEIQGNMRLLEFDQSLFPITTTQAIWAPAATKIFPNVATWQPAFDSQNHMVVGYNSYWGANPGDSGRFPGVYFNPLGAATTPDSFLSDYTSMAIAAAFDSADNLYLADLDRARVHIYRGPLNPPTATPTATATGTASPTPSRTATSTITVTASRTATATATIPPTVTTTPSHTATVTLTATPSHTATATATPTVVPPTLTATGTPAASPTIPPTATGTATTIAIPSATATGTATTPATATGTPSATATACALHFSDVTDVGAYYYAGVYYLACRGVVTGYSDGTYRPFRNTTRGQLAKIVVLGFALPFQTPAGGAYRFTDVLPTDTFFPYVETAAAAGIVTGYACGHTNPQTGLLEVCDSNSRPYYRPANYVTRGQLAKIVVIAATQAQGWTLLNPPMSTFSDVPGGSTFYQYVETAVCHGILGGYADGTYRPANNATRGQLAKIVTTALTVSGACGP